MINLVVNTVINFVNTQDKSENRKTGGFLKMKNSIKYYIVGTILCIICYLYHNHFLYAEN